MPSVPALPLPASEASLLRWRVGDEVQTSLLRYRVIRGSEVEGRTRYYGQRIAVRLPGGTWREISHAVDEEPLFQAGTWEVVTRMARCQGCNQSGRTNWSDGRMALPGVRTATPAGQYCGDCWERLGLKRDTLTEDRSCSYFHAGKVSKF